jgi:hypothetical protein
MYFGASSFVERVTASVSPLVLILLRLLGDTRGHALGIHLVGPVAGLALLAAFVLFRRYDVPDVVPEPAAEPLVAARVAPALSGS